MDNVYRVYEERTLTGNYRYKKGLFGRLVLQVEEGTGFRDICELTGDVKKEGWIIEWRNAKTKDVPSRISIV